MFVRPQYRLRVSTRYRAPAEQVWDHVTDVQAIAAEFPPWAPFHFTRPDEVARALETQPEAKAMTAVALCQPRKTPTSLRAITL